MNSSRIPAKKRNRAFAAVVSTAAAAAVLAGCSSGSSSSSPAASSAASAPAAGSSAAPSGADPALVKLLPASIKSSGTLSFGALFQTPPAIAADPNDASKPVGIAPDISQEFGKLLGLKVVWKNLQWPAQIPGVESGSVDALFGQISDTAVREQTVLDIVPWSYDSWSIVVAAGNPKKITTLANACGDTIGVPIGSTQSEMVAAAAKNCTKSGKPAIVTRGYTDANGALTALRSGNIDGWINDTASQKDAVAAAPSSFTSVELPKSDWSAFDSGVGGIAVAKSNTGLSEALMGALKEMIANGTYQQILDKWKSSSLALPDNLAKVNPLSGTPVGTKKS